MRRVACLTTILGLVGPSAAHPQTWNDSATAALVDRAVARRARALADTTLRDYRARAHGFVFFLGQFGEGFAEPPRLVKSDELVLEVYWKAPGRSKQRIIGWRDREDLPTGIEYHRDHLGIVQNNFDNRIGLGHDDEVRNVPHPLAPDGPERYDYALVDSLAIRLPGRVVQVHELLTRPKEPRTPGVVGSLYLDVATAELVRFRFNFTRAAYVDPSLEDITIVLENGLWNERYWLPRRQDIEIRRRSTWLELPARGIIRGRWEITDYAFNVGLGDTLFGGFPIVAAPQAERDRFRWETPLDASIRGAVGPVAGVDLDEVRAKVRDVVAEGVVSGLPTARLSVGALSDLLHYNRVEGLTPGLGWVFRPPGGPEIRVWGGYGISDDRLKARIALARSFGRYTLEGEVARVIEDVGDAPVIAPLVNSLVAQELGDDFGDYVLVERARATLRRRFGPGSAISLTLGVERPSTVGVEATPASHAFRPNPALGGGMFGVGMVEARARTTRAGGLRADAGAAIEFGWGEASYRRVRAHGSVVLDVGGTEVVGEWVAGWASVELPPHRAFVFGGRGTLMSTPFRPWGGRRLALGRVEWRFAFPFPALQLGSFASTGPRAVVAPFLAVGAAGGDVPGTPWDSTSGVVGVGGVAVELFHQLLRIEIGASLHRREAGIVLDVRRDLWGIL